MPTFFVESFEEFSQRHGGNPLKGRDQIIRFPDGACCNADGTVFQEPPQGRSQQLHAIRAYRYLGMERALKDFDAMKRSMLENIHNAQLSQSWIAPPADCQAELEKRGAAFFKWKSECDYCDQEIAQTPEALAAAARQEELRKHQADLAALEGAIRDTTLESIAAKNGQVFEEPTEAELALALHQLLRADMPAPVRRQMDRLADDLRKKSGMIVDEMASGMSKATAVSQPKGAK